jgi:RNA polymerase sigma-70 factor (sigma-E family)
MTTARNDTANTRQDDLLAHVYQQVIDAQAEQYAAAWDATAGLARFTDWLRDHPAADLDADQAVARLYSRHYQPLVRLAAMLVRDTTTAEDVVQDAFIAMHGAWPRLRDAENALAYLRQAVVNRSRSVLRHQMVADNNQPETPPDTPSGEHGTFELLERSAVIAALRGLPQRQREAIVLWYYADLSENEIAAAMGISRGAVRSHTARGLPAFRAALEQAASQSAPPGDSEHGPSDP